MAEIALPPRFRLNPNRIDFDSILSQLMSQVQQRAAATGNQSLMTHVSAGIGQTTLEMVAAGTEAALLMFERCLQENYSDTALIPTSDIRMARDHAVHIQRNRSAQIEVTFTRLATQSADSILPYTTFFIDGEPWFNRFPIAFPAGVNEVTATLTEGRMQREDVVSLGVMDLMVYIGPPGFIMSDDDLFAICAGDRWEVVRDGIWHHSGSSKVFYENTMPDGRVDVQFGNGASGAVPPAGEIISFFYAISRGAEGNGVPAGQPVSVTGRSDIVGVTTSLSNSGQDFLRSDFYKRHGAYIYAAKEKAARRRDYNSLALTYPGVIAAKILGQAELAPGDVRYMNILQAAILTDPPWTNVQWEAFKRWLQEEKGLAVAHVIRKRTEAISFPIKATLYCFNNADLGSTTQLVTQRLQSMFALSDVSLGRIIAPSDIENVMLTTTLDGDSVLPDDRLVEEQFRLIDYVRIDSPTIITTLQMHQYPVLGALNLNAVYSPRNKPRII